MGSNLAVEIQGLGKCYRLGEYNAGRFYEDLTSWFKKNKTAKTEGNLQDYWALRGINLEIRKGEAVGVIGSNGAGKSTLLKILSRITKPTEGQGVIRGRAASLLEVGTGFHPELTGRDNIFLNGAILGLKKNEIAQQFDSIVDFSGVNAFIDTPVKRYSSGMYVRLAFAVAAHLEPDILIADEVLAVGDAEFQAKCLKKMGEIGGEGRTVLFVSHNMGAVRTLTERCIVLSKGKLIFDGSTDEAVQIYLKSFRESSCNVIDLSTAKREHASSDEWRFTSIAILAPEGGWAYGDTLRFKLSYITQRRASDVSLVIHICDIFGTKLVTCRSCDDGFTFNNNTGDCENIVVSIADPKLPPGTYCVWIGAFSGKQHILDMIVQASQFEIKPQNCLDYWTETAPFQGIRLPSQWGKV